jgi:hypothetical protein
MRDQQTRCVREGEGETSRQHRDYRDVVSRPGRGRETSRRHRDYRDVDDGEREWFEQTNKPMSQACEPVTESRIPLFSPSEPAIIAGSLPPLVHWRARDNRGLVAASSSLPCCPFTAPLLSLHRSLAVASLLSPLDALDHQQALYWGLSSVHTREVSRPSLRPHSAYIARYPGPACDLIPRTSRGIRAQPATSFRAHREVSGPGLHPADCPENLFFLFPVHGKVSVSDGAYISIKSTCHWTY